MSNRNELTEARNTAAAAWDRVLACKPNSRACLAAEADHRAAWATVRALRAA